MCPSLPRLASPHLPCLPRPLRLPGSPSRPPGASSSLDSGAPSSATLAMPAAGPAARTEWPAVTGAEVGADDDVARLLLWPLPASKQLQPAAQTPVPGSADRPAEEVYGDCKEWDEWWSELAASPPALGSLEGLDWVPRAGPQC